MLSLDGATDEHCIWAELNVWLMTDDWSRKTLQVVLADETFWTSKHKFSFLTELFVVSFFRNKLWQCTLIESSSIAEILLGIVIAHQCARWALIGVKSWTSGTDNSPIETEMQPTCFSFLCDLLIEEKKLKQKSKRTENGRNPSIELDLSITPSWTGQTLNPD